MTIAGLLILFIVVGVVMWLINTYIPMQPAIKNLMNIAIVVVMVLYLLAGFGLIGPLNAPIRPIR